MSDSFFATLPLGTRIRQAAVAVVKSQGTLAGLSVFDSPLDPLPEGIDSAVAIYSTERRDTIAAASSLPGFRVMFTLHVQSFVLSADPKTAEEQADILKQQVMDALFEDPVWPGMQEAIETIEEKRNRAHDGERYRFEHQLSIQSAWRETFTPRGTSVLQPGGQPALPRAVVSNLALVKNTIVAGSAPGAGGQGTAPTSFETDVTFSPF